MTASGGYTFRIDDAEIARFNVMAHSAERHEHQMWTRAGIALTTTVLDLGCGPGALLPILAQRVGSSGTIIAVDADPRACAAAARVAEVHDTRTQIVCADAAETGLPAAAADVVMCRNLLVHNGRRVGDILTHAAALLRPVGRLLSAEPDVAGIDFGAADAEHEFESRWAAMNQAEGSDPLLGRGNRLPDLLRHHGWQVLDTLAWTDHLVIDRSPAWAAADTVVSRGFATPSELARWQAALERRRASGPLKCSLTMTTVVAAPNERPMPD